MSRPRGGIIGVNATPAASALNSAASGAWTLREAEALKRAGTWPTAPRQPEAPSGLSVVAGNASLTLSWTAPTSDLPITGYIVEYTASGGSAQTISTGTTATTYAITGLTNGTTYTMRVAAVSDLGAGAYSATANGTPTAAESFTSRTISNGEAQGTPASWSGTGTASNKLTPSQVFASATLTVGVAGTLRITGNVNDGFDDYAHYIRKNGGSSLIASNGIFAINVSVSVAAGDIIQFISDPQDRVFGETRVFGSACNIRVWIE